MGRFGVNRGHVRALVSLATAAVIGGILSTPAMAAPAASSESALAGDCPFAGALCLFEGTGYTGERFTVQSSTPPAGVCVDLVEHGWGGRAHSAINNNSKAAAIFASDDCTGHPLSITGSSPNLSLSGNSVFVS